MKFFRSHRSWLGLFVWLLDANVDIHLKDLLAELGIASETAACASSVRDVRGCSGQLAAATLARIPPFISASLGGLADQGTTRIPCRVALRARQVTPAGFTYVNFELTCGFFDSLPSLVALLVSNVFYLIEAGDCVSNVRCID